MKLTATLFTVVGLAAIALLWFHGTSYLSQRKQEAKNAAVQGCMEVSSYTYVNQETGVTTVEPIETSYTKCLQLKGY